MSHPASTRVIVNRVIKRLATNGIHTTETTLWHCDKLLLNEGKPVMGKSTALVCSAADFGPCVVWITDWQLAGPGRVTVSGADAETVARIVAGCDVDD